MTPKQACETAARLETAIELFDVALAMLRTRLRRDKPGISDAEVEAEVARWLGERKGAEDGDGVGRRVSLPRHGR